MKNEMHFKIIILSKLFRHRIIGEKHTAFEHITSGIPKHFAGAAKIAAEELIMQNLILAKPTSYGLQISLNPDKLEEIMLLIGDNTSSL